MKTQALRTAIQHKLNGICHSWPEGPSSTTGQPEIQKNEFLTRGRALCH